MGRLDGKVAIVTGAGQGIGRGVALAMAKEGATVVVTEINPKTAASTVAEIKSLGGQTLAVACDVSQQPQVAATVAAAMKRFQRIDILVNNAQGNRFGVPFEETTDEDWSLTLRSGLMGTFYFMKACFPHMKDHGGKIINFASASGTEGQAGFTAYAGTKEAIRGITRVAAHEWGQYKINVNAICPFANSPACQVWKKLFPAEFQQMVDRVPMRRVGDCEQDIGRVAVFLASPDSDFITGHTIMADGGQFILR